MQPSCEYDSLASIYDQWSRADPAAEKTLRFYTDVCLQEPGAVVELGVGTGRIALTVARQGKPVIGIDCSSAMLSVCESARKQLGLADKLQLLSADVRTFTLARPATLAIFPFRSFGHLLTDEEKIQALQNIRRNLEPGGRLILDHYVFDPAWAEAYHGVPRLMCSNKRPTGDSEFIWDTYLYDISKQLMQCLITVETVDITHTVIRRRHYPLSFSWVYPTQMESLFQYTGLQIDRVYGDFSGGAFDNQSEQQIWIVRRPIDE